MIIGYYVKIGNFYVEYIWITNGTFQLTSNKKNAKVFEKIDALRTQEWIYSISPFSITIVEINVTETESALA